PNPNNGNFTFHAGLQGKQTFVILVLDAWGNERARMQVYESDSWTGTIDVANPVPGNYFIRVIAEYDSAQLPFVITQ
ncbi:MAG TPA: T9SS type A sorting domain-containing protein, partial [Bacteroidia bacterium]|nr:T9SS type A sorting domain-containing protein [Bacteroidia bacterium]